MGHPGDADHDPEKDADEEPAANGANGTQEHVPDAELTARAPVTKDRTEECWGSARYWARALPAYADREQRKADWSSLLAGIIAAVTGLGIWPLLTGVSDNQPTAITPGAILFSLAALAAAILALLPRIYNFAEMAGAARELASRYGALIGALEDIVLQPAFDPIAARPVVEEFEATKAKKDALRRLPNRDQEETTWAGDRTLRAKAETAAAEEELKAVKAKRALSKARAEEPEPKP